MSPVGPTSSTRWLPDTIIIRLSPLSLSSLLYSYIKILKMTLYEGGLQQGAGPQVPVHGPGSPRLWRLHRPRGRAGEGKFLGQIYLINLN